MENKQQKPTSGAGGPKQEEENKLAKPVAKKPESVYHAPHWNLTVE
jgi:hypothetical protein